MTLKAYKYTSKGVGTLHQNDSHSFASSTVHRTNLHVCSSVHIPLLDDVSLDRASTIFDRWAPLECDRVCCHFSHCEVFGGTWRACKKKVLNRLQIYISDTPLLSLVLRVSLSRMYVKNGKSHIEYAN